MTRIEFSKLVPAERLQGEDEEDTRLLKEMLQEARNYLTSFPWCEKIAESYLGIGIGGVVAVFLFRIDPVGENVDEWIWVIIGDLPPAYITVDCAPNPASALDGYIGAMQEWLDAAKAGRPMDNLIPVNVTPTPESALQLESRLNFLDKEILSRYPDDLG